MRKYYTCVSIIFPSVTFQWHLIKKVSKVSDIIPLCEAISSIGKADLNKPVSSPW